jgi:hypothetical protein
MHKLLKGFCQTVVFEFNSQMCGEISFDMKQSSTSPTVSYIKLKVDINLFKKVTSQKLWPHKHKFIEIFII